MNKELSHLLRDIKEKDLKLVPFRSSGFINRDYDKARLSIDLDIIVAKRLEILLKEYLQVN